MKEPSDLSLRCAQVGLALRGHERRGALLILQPASLTDLPSAEVLRALAETLRTDGVRWVALDLEEAP